MLRVQGLRVRFGVLNLPFALLEAPCEDCGSFGFALASLCRFRKPGDPASVPGFGSNLPAPATNLNKSPALHILSQTLNRNPSNRMTLSALSYSKSIKLETGLRQNSAGIRYTLVLWIEAVGVPTFRLLL